MRPSGRTSEQMREIHITLNFTKHAEGDDPFTGTPLPEILDLASNSIKDLIGKKEALEK